METSACDHALASQWIGLPSRVYGRTTPLLGQEEVLMDSVRFSRQRFAFLIGVPVAWAVLLLFHPLGSGSMYDVLRDEVTRWQVVHVGTLLFIGLMGLAVYL